MAYLINLEEQRSQRSADRVPADSWLTRLLAQRSVQIVAIALGLVSTGTVIYRVLPRSPVIAQEDPNSAQEIADDGGGSSAIGANGEVADDSSASRVTSAR